MKKIRVGFLQVLVGISVSLISVATVAFASTVIDSNGVTTDNVATKGLNVKVATSSDGITDILSVAPDMLGMYDIGIGTTTPDDRLHIHKGNLYFTGVMFPALRTGDGVQALAIRSTIDPFLTGIGSSTVPRATYDFDTTTGRGLEMTSSHFNYNGDYLVNSVFKIAADPTLFSYINSGNFGIGTTTPINLFSVVASSTNSVFDVTADGRIGVGTAYPVSYAKMEINYNSAVDGGAGLVVSDGGSAHVMLGATSTSGYVGNYNNNSFSIRTNNEDRFMIYDKNAGSDVRFGFGTTTPESFFHVSKENATTTVEIGSTATTGKGSCLKLRDSDGQGWTYCTTLAGSLTCSTTSCE